MPRTHFSLLTALSLTAFLVACGGGGGSSNSTPDTGGETVTDTTPNAFNFTALADAALNTAYESEAFTLAGINAETSISISGGEYAVNGGNFSTSAGKVNNGDSIVVRVTSSSEHNTASSATLTIGDVNASFSVTTGAAAPASGAVKVDVNLDLVHSVGSVDSFDRRKFITIHASNAENDWFGGDANSLGAPNEDPELITHFLETYDVYLGRDTGTMSWQLKQLPEDPNRSGFIDVATATANGGGSRWNYTNGTSSNATLIRQHAHRATDMVVAAQQHPYWPDGTEIGTQGWSFSQTDSQAEPFGTAVGHYMANFLYEYFNRGGTDTFGQPKPVFLEVMNEPLYELVDFPIGTATTPQKVFEFHNAVANEVRAYRDPWNQASHSNVKIGGYTVAFPDFEKNNFERWETRDKLFIDLAGANMDFISMHLYDFPTFNGTNQLRRGSNVEATFDMIEQYMMLQLGERKPFVISELGASTHQHFNEPWTPYRDGLKLTALNGILMSLLERPDQIAKAIPFIPVKAEWGRKSATIPYNDRLMRQKKEASGETGDAWVYTDMVKFYQLWSDVKGKRLDSWTSDLDVQADAYTDGNLVFLVLNNLEADATDIDLALLGANGKTINYVSIKELYLDANGNPQLSQQAFNTIPDTLVLQGQATMVIAITYAEALAPSGTLAETKYYATHYKQAINANSAITFSINDVVVGAEGEAVLRLGVGRAHGKSFTPTAMLNGHMLTVPTDYRGYDQYDAGKGRPTFYGVLEIPVSLAQLESTNSLELTFPDDGGYVASVSVQVFNANRALNRGAR